MKKRRILVVDDDPQFVKVLTLSLKAHNYDIDVATDGIEALEKAKEKPQMILLDVNMPKMNGYEVCYNLRQDSATRFIPIVMLTGKDAPEEKIEGFYVGADDYITKPYDTRILFARIEAIFRRIEFADNLLKDRPRAIRELKRIIKEESITPLFQPIYSLISRRVLATEVLSRPPEYSYFSNSAVLFEVAFRLGMYFDLELSCHKKALCILKKRVKEIFICFNISPSFVEDKRYTELIPFYKSYINANMITLELTERTAIHDFDTFINKLKVFKNEGFKISIDDIGSGYASLRSIVELKPDFVKIDQHLVRGLHNDKVRQNLIKAIIVFCKDCGITSIAEGVESDSELATLAGLGVDACQGYLLGTPQPDITWEQD